MRVWCVAAMAAGVVGSVAVPAIAQTSPVNARQTPVAPPLRRAGFRAGLSLEGTAGVGIAPRLGYQFDTWGGVFAETSLTVLLPWEIVVATGAIGMQVNVGTYFFFAFGPAVMAIGARPGPDRARCATPTGVCPVQGLGWSLSPAVFARIGAEVPLRVRDGSTLGALSFALVGRAALATPSGPVLPFPALEIGYETY